MFWDLVPRLTDRYHVIAPDWTQLAYPSDNYAEIVGKLPQQIGLGHYALYIMDYSAPVGFLVASGAPAKLTALIVQNGNAYDEDIAGFWNQGVQINGGPPWAGGHLFAHVAESRQVAVYQLG
jgi:hypothetical protein